jgi:hypothetical protein
MRFSFNKIKKQACEFTVGTRIFMFWKKCYVTFDSTDKRFFVISMRIYRPLTMYTSLQYKDSNLILIQKRTKKKDSINN